MIEKIIIEKTYSAIVELFGQKPDIKHIQIQKTKKDFEGDFTLVVFPFLKLSRKSPEQTADLIGKYLETNLKEIESYNVIKGFLNLLVSKNFWLGFFADNYKNSEKFGFIEQDDSKPVVNEFSSPNTNKPLHLGHIRNNLIGYSVSKILQANGKNVVTVSEYLDLAKTRKYYLSELFYRGNGLLDYTDKSLIAEDSITKVSTERTTIIYDGNIVTGTTVEKVL